MNCFGEEQPIVLPSLINSFKCLISRLLFIFFRAWSVIIRAPSWPWCCIIKCAVSCALARPRWERGICWWCSMCRLKTGRCWGPSLWSIVWSIGYTMVFHLFTSVEQHRKGFNSLYCYCGSTYWNAVCIMKWWQSNEFISFPFCYVYISVMLHESAVCLKKNKIWSSLKKCKLVVDNLSVFHVLVFNNLPWTMLNFSRVKQSFRPVLCLYKGKRRGVALRCCSRDLCRFVILVWLRVELACRA